MLSSKELEIQSLKKDIELLTDNYLSTTKKARSYNTPADKNNLDRQAQDLLEQIKAKEDELSLLQDDSEEQEYNQAYLNIESELSQFNFESTVTLVEEVINRFKIKNGFALFFLQKSISTGGDYFSDRFREILRTKTKEGNFCHRLIEFKEICPPQKTEILNKFYKYFPVDSISDSIEEYSQQIIARICESIPQSGFILLIEISGLEYLLEKEKIIPWFIKDFWHGLSMELQNKLSQKGYKKVRVFCLMKTDDCLPDDCLPSYIYYELAKLNSSEVRELTIELCSREEIEDFLYTFGGFDDLKVQQLVQLIYSTSNNGNPDIVCRKLKQFLTPVN